MSEWRLIHVSETEWQQDKSGIFTYISYQEITGTVRLDVMAETDTVPVISFQGKAGDVRKVAIRWIEQQARKICGISNRLKNFSYEHASYIGSELARAELLKDEYNQS